MVKNYLRLALRNLWQNKTVSGTNILGLTIGISCSLLLLLYVKYEYSYDKFLPHLDNTYFQILEQTGANARTVGLSHERDYQDLRANYPTVEDVVKIRNNSFDMSAAGDEKQQVLVKSWFASENFFSFFGFQLLAGDAEQVLKDPSSIVLTESAAKKLFGEENPIGKVVTLRTFFEKDLVVSGIAADVDNSHISFEAIIPWEMTRPDGRVLAHMSYQASLYTYVKLTEGAEIGQLKASRNERLSQLDAEYDGSYYYDFVPLKEMYLGTSHVQFMAFQSGNASTVNTLFAIALIILLVACINYINLQTAKGSKRSLEVGMRKVLGAHRGQLIFQFLGESIMVTLISAVLAILVLDLSLPAFNELTGKTFTISSLQEEGLFVFLLIIALLTAILSGIYPALVLSSFLPSKVLKLSSSSSMKGNRARKVLIFAQFVISLFLIAVTIVAYRQTQFINQKELGFNKNQVISFNISTRNLDGNYQSFQAELNANPGVLSTSVSTDILGPGYTNNSGPFYLQSNPELSVRSTLFGVDHSFLDTYEIEVLQGRAFDRNVSTDSSALIVNEAFVKQMGVENPLEEKVAIWSLDYGALPIIGVVKDFNFQKLHQEISPAVFRISPRNIWYLSVRLDKDRIPETLNFIESKWNEFEPEESFTYSFVDQRLDRFYESEIRLLKAITVFSIVSIVLTALGLFGMVTFVIERKTKEIGIRKVLGASLTHINLIVFSEFFRLLIIALVVSTPLVIMAGQDWLSQFAYRVNIGAVPVVIAIVLTLTVILLTVGIQSLKAANQNPIKSLRDE